MFLWWDKVRERYGLGKEEYEPAEEALRRCPLGNIGRMYFWQAETESFPVSGIFEQRIGYDEPELASDYAAILEGYRYQCKPVTGALGVIGLGGRAS